MDGVDKAGRQDAAGDKFWREWAVKTAQRHPFAVVLSLLFILVSITGIAMGLALVDFPKFLETLGTLLLAGIVISATYQGRFNPLKALALFGVFALWIAIVASASLQAWIDRHLNPPADPVAVAQDKPTALPPRPAAIGTAPTTPPAATPKFVDKTFVADSDSVNVGCGAKGGTSVEAAVPVGSEVVSAVATWVETNNIRNSATTVTRDTAAGKVIGTGSIDGLDYQTLFAGIKNCPGGGHAKLHLEGVYRASAS